MFLKGEILIQYIPFSVRADKLMSISYKYNSINLDDYLELRNHVNKTPVTREIADEIMKNSICTVTAFDEEKVKQWDLEDLSGMVLLYAIFRI